ncbi:hypothetical protein [Ornithinimicrobium flavum]|uniref:hypothetical protein n=1 Tax=Ornithinimicrobium flavum TaxID=1288636 RepID=UPI0010705980|nr:hypothetical protein [Ornithinimicrobium flavum]
MVERIRAESPVAGLEVFAGERMTVALWEAPEDAEAFVPLVGPHDPGGPSDVRTTEVEGVPVAFSMWAGDVVRMPVELLDVYVVGSDSVQTLTGAPVTSEVLSTRDARAVAWADASRGVWGYAVHAQDPMLAQVGEHPAQVSSSASTADELTVSAHLLPQGADLVDVRLDAGDSDSTVLEGREVVLVEQRGVDSAEVVFRLAGAEFTADQYHVDLATLQVGEELTLEESRSVPGGVALLTASDSESVLTVSPQELDRGLVTTTVDGRPVVVAAGWDAGADVLLSSRVELDDGSGPRWVDPEDVAQTVLADGRSVTLLAVDLTGDDQVLAVGRQDGDEVARWEPPVRTAGVEWRQVDGAPVPFVDGAALPRLDDGATDEVRHYADGSGSARGYVVLPGQAAGATFVPLLEGDGELLTAPEMVHQVDEVEVGDGTDTVLTVVGGLDDEGGSTLAGVAAQRASEGAANTWTVVGDASSAHVVVDPGLVVTIGAEQGVWLVYPTGSVDPSQVQAGRIGQDLALLRTAPGTDSTLVAVSPEGAPAPRVGVDDGQVEPPATHPVPQLDLVVRVWTLTGP